MKETDAPKLLRPFYKDYRSQLKYIGLFFNKFESNNTED
jgi:hypothetical protein